MSAAATFRTLTAAFHQDSSSDHVETLAADFAAKVAAFGCPTCLSVIKPEGQRQFYGVAVLLSGYGITLRSRHRADKRAVLIYAEVSSAPASEYQGATVREVKTRVAA